MLKKVPDIAQVLAQEDQRSRRRRLVGWILVAAVGALAALAAWWWFAGSDRRNDQQFVTELAELADIRVVVVAAGSLEPIGTAAVSSTISGTIDTVSVRANDRVSKGQVLARLDMGDLDSRLAAAVAMSKSQEANLLVANINLADAEAALARTETLSSGQSVSARDLELAASAVKRAQAQQALADAQLRAAEADLQAARNDFEKACICSPIEGVVLEANITPGQAITGAAVGQSLFVIAEDLRRLDLQVDIDEADVGSVREGDAATFAVEAWPGRNFSGVIREIRFAPKVIDGVVSYRALLDVDNSDMLLRPGMTATADIVVDEVDSTLSVPNAALRFSLAAAAENGLFDTMMPTSSIQAPDGASRTVWILRDGKPTEAEVTVGLSDGQRSQITSGSIEPGDAVIVGTAAR